MFYVTFSGNFERFQYFNFKADFLENENLSQKTGIPFLVESTKIKIASFPCKTAIPEANVKDTHRQKAPSIKTPALTESGVWAFGLQGSIITIKSPYVITYVCQNLGIRDVRGQIRKSIYQASYFLPDLPNNFS